MSISDIVIIILSKHPCLTFLLGLFLQLGLIVLTQLFVLWVVLIRLAVSFLIVIQNLLFFSIYLCLDFLSSFLLFLQVAGRKVWFTLFGFLQLFLLHLLLFSFLFYLLVVRLEILGRFYPCVLYYPFAPLFLLRLSLDISTFHIDFGMDGRMISNQILLQILINGFIQLLPIFHCCLHIPSLLSLLHSLLVIHSQLRKCAEMINRIVKACSLLSWIIFLRFRHLLFALQIDRPELGLFYLLLLFLLCFGSPLRLLVIFRLLLYEFFNLGQFFLGSPHVVLWAFVRTLIWFLFGGLFIFFYPFLYLLYFLLFQFQIRLIMNRLAALNSTFAVIRLMIPFVAMRSQLILTFRP